MLVEHEIWQRRWWWIGHSLCKPVDSITWQTLTRNSEGKKERGMAEKYVAQWSETRHQRNWIQLETVWEIDSGPECLVESCWRPVPHEERWMLWFIECIEADRLLLICKLYYCFCCITSAVVLLLYSQDKSFCEITLYHCNPICMWIMLDVFC